MTRVERPARKIHASETSERERQRRTGGARPDDAATGDADSALPNSTCRGRPHLPPNRAPRDAADGEDADSALPNSAHRGIRRGARWPRAPAAEPGAVRLELSARLEARERTEEREDRATGG